MELTKEPVWKTYSMSVEDYEKLAAFYSQSVPFKGTSGKYAIYSGINYPRYKIRASFNMYNEKSVSKRNIAKNVSYADYYVMPVKEIKEVFSKSRLEKEVGNKSAYHNHSNYRQFETERRVFKYIERSELDLMSAAIQYYKDCESNPSLIKPLIDFQEFASNMDDLKERLTIPKAEFLVDLLKGDKSSVRLAMESLTNFDLTRSIPAILYVIGSTSSHTMKNCDYWYGTAFRAFKQRFGTVIESHLESCFSEDLTKVYDRLKDDITITKSEYLAIRQAIYEKYLEKAKDDEIVLAITPESITLKFKPENIIDDEIVEAEDRIREESALDDTDTAYILVDDTNTSA